jgi:hypothetical protein
MLDFITNHTGEILLVVMPIVIMSPYIAYKSLYQIDAHDILIRNMMNDDKTLISNTREVCDTVMTNVLQAVPQDAAPDLKFIERIPRNIDVIQANLNLFVDRTDAYIGILTDPAIAPSGPWFIVSMLLCSLGIAVAIVIYKYFH